MKNDEVFNQMHLALVMVADTIPFNFLEPMIQKMVLDAIEAGSEVRKEAGNGAPT